MIFIDSNILIYSYSSTEIGKKDIEGVRIINPFL